MLTVIKGSFKIHGVRPVRRGNQVRLMFKGAVIGSGKRAIVYSCIDKGEPFICPLMNGRERLISS